MPKRDSPTFKPDYAMNNTDQDHVTICLYPILYLLTVRFSEIESLYDKWYE